MCTRMIAYQEGVTRRSRLAWPFLVFVLALGLGTLFATTQPVAAALPTLTACRADLKGKDHQFSGGTNDQGDLTQFCLAAGDSQYDFYASWSWDEPSFGSQTGDGCLLFDSNNDGLVNYAACVTVTGSGQLDQMHLYSCNNTRPNNCDSPVLINAVNTTCETSLKFSDPFKPGQQDTVAVCGVKFSDFAASTTLTLIDACAYSSSSPSSNARDCILFKGGCGSDADCNDNDSCTTDTCNLTDPNNSFCQFTPSSPGSCSDNCTTGGTCDPSGFCQGGTPVSCDDQNACTNDSCSPATGACVYVSNGSCDDPCLGIDCSGSSDACNVGKCVVNSGQVECQKTPANAGALCDDGNACTQTDTCQSGVCVGANPVLCTASDQCHDAGTCDPSTGVCSNPPAQDGTSCNDGDACTQTDTCQSGACVGANPVVCAASDQCHTVGECDSSTGTCSNPTAPDATPCDDSSACTQTDTCQSGVCVGSNPVVCTPLDQCHVAGTCDPASGQCSNPSAPDGTGCNDGNACTTVDQCKSGSCVGSTPPNCEDSNVCTVDSCDPATGCTHTPGNAGTVCRTGSGDVCDPDEKCTGISATCPSNVVQPSTFVCRTGSGDVCDPDEKCTGVAGQACPVDVVQPKTYACRTAAGVCDIAENCTGTPKQTCPTNALEPSTYVCRPAASDCDIADKCTGVDVTCSADATSCLPTDTPTIEPTGTTCQQFKNGTVLPLAELYTLKSGKINSISPGVFFVYDTVHLATSGNGIITVTESDGWTASKGYIGVSQSQVMLYDALNCNTKRVGTLKVDANGKVTITGVPAGNYILSVKYDPTTLNGYAPSTPSTTYKFQVQAGGLSSGSASVAINKK